MGWVPVRKMTEKTSSLAAKTFPFDDADVFPLVLRSERRHLTLASQLIDIDSTRHALATTGPPYM